MVVVAMGFGQRRQIEKSVGNVNPRPVAKNATSGAPFRSSSYTGLPNAFRQHEYAGMCHRDRGGGKGMSCDCARENGKGGRRIAAPADRTPERELV